MTEKVFEHYYWEELDTNVLRLGLAVDRLSIPNLVLAGIPRGGLVPAVVLSHNLNTPHKFINLSACDLSKHCGEDKNLIVVDEILDSGKTLETTIAYLSSWDWKSIRFVFLHAKKRHALLPMEWKVVHKCPVISVSTDLPENIFVVYPWER